MVKLTAENVQNLGGRISGNTVTLDARVDVNNIGGALLANNALTLTAGRDIKIDSTVRSASSAADGNSFSRTTIDRVAGLYVTGTGAGGKLSLTAGRDITLTAGQIGNNSVNGATSLDAGRNIELGTLTTASANNLVWDANNYRKDSSTSEVGSQIFGGGGSVLLKAGADVNLRAATVQTGGALTVQAGNDINILAGSERNTVDEGHRHTDKGFLHTEVITTRNTLAGTDAVGSTLGGGTVALLAGRDLGVTGSSVTGDGGMTLVAGRDVTIAAATETLSTGTYRSVKESGFLGGGGGFGISYGERTTTTDRSADATTQSGQARSALGATHGDLVISAGNALKIGGSDLLAKGDMTLAGKSVTVDAGVDDSRGLVKTKTTQDALSLAVGGSVVGAIQAAQGMGASLNKSKDARLTAMVAATAAMAAANAAKALAAEGLSVNISLTAGHAESEQTRTTTNTEHTGSTIEAGKNLSISATGGGKDSNIVIAGSDVKAGNALTLTAGNQISVTSAQDLESQHSESKSMNAAAGVAAGYSSKGGLAIGFTGSAGLGQGKEDGEGVTQRNSHVVAGGKLTLISGGDTAIQGAVLKGAQVEADVGGNLHIESRQDTATFDSKNQSVNVSAIVGYGASVSGNINQSKIRSDYASVQEQSGIQAGDGGFQVRVGGNTDLKGATIGSTAAGAAASVLNTGTLTQSDIANHATMQASSVGLSGATTISGSGDTARGKGTENLEKPYRAA